MTTISKNQQFYASYDHWYDCFHIYDRVTHTDLACTLQAQSSDEAVQIAENTMSKNLPEQLEDLSNVPGFTEE